MRLVVVALMLLIAGATHAAAQQYQLFPASVAATNLQVQHQAVLVNTGGDAPKRTYTVVRLRSLPTLVSDPTLMIRSGTISPVGK
jgi:hypothetical protein